MEVKTNELSAISEDGEIITVFEYKDLTPPDPNDHDHFNIPRPSKPRYETAHGEAVLRISETGFQIMEDGKMHKYYYIKN